MNSNHRVNLRQIADYLGHFPEPEKPIQRRWLSTLLTDAVVHTHLPRDEEVEELIFLGATTVFGMPAWRYAGAVSWNPGHAPETSTHPIELGILPELSEVTCHPRALDGEDYPDDLPLPNENPLLPFMQWALPATVAIGGALYWISR